MCKQIIDKKYIDKKTQVTASQNYYNSTHWDVDRQSGVHTDQLSNGANDVTDVLCPI